VYQVGKETKYSQMMHSQPSIKMMLRRLCVMTESLLLN